MNAQGNPKSLKSWKRGQSGNPGGRPRITDEALSRARAYMERAGWAELEWVAAQRKERWAGAKVAALKEIANRAYGQPPQEISGETQHVIIRTTDVGPDGSRVVRDMERVIFQDARH
jgi:hypothetical protein